MSPGNLFHYFPTKASIIEAIAQDEQLATAEIFEKWSGAEDALTAIEEIVVEWMRLASEPTYARISIEVGAEASRNPDIKALFLVNDQRVKGRMITLIERGIRQGAIDAALAPDLLASWLIALAEGAVGRVVFESKFDLSAHEPVFRRIVRRTLQK
ncbi:hypothetical protein PHO31112_02767 [Pandoraea horticolens]|uniref:BetI-type transcriptional repressor C-terminal domain-containing protein n=2 Tax=Pandoraea horticolens TaxID=2508298 RepID=A0A5E4VSA2_9BURK|nr:hypothetical protein PHO31112_02767 [Pandoraea horticolens]